MERLFRRSVRGQVCKPLRREEPVCSQERQKIPPPGRQQ